MNRAEKEALRLLQRYDVHAPPIPVDALAQQEGAQIARLRFKGPESGFALRDRNSWIIGVNTLTSARRQRFTIAHELGHLLLHEGKPLIVDQAILVNKRDEISSMATDAEEIEANRFAATLLMPRDFVLSRLERLLQSEGEVDREDLITQLARTFNVSAEAMGYRLINLNILVP